MTNINNMSGIEFELFCKDLLEKNGFTVSTTATTGDGGIDLIAINNNPFFKGKYIVQCKRYTGTVGEPVIRDLYGVVMAERANKGILITTGTFTTAAESFAKDKQLELIDGNLLASFVNNLETPHSSSTDLSFLDTKKYNYFIEQLSNKSVEYSVFIDFLNFLSSYVIDRNAEETQAVMFDEIYTSYFNVLENYSDIDQAYEYGAFEKVIAALNKLNDTNKIIEIDKTAINNTIIPQMRLTIDGLINHKICKTKNGRNFAQIISFRYNGLIQLLSFDFSEYISSRIQFLKGSNSTYSVFNDYTYERWSNSNPALLNSCEITNVLSLLFYLRLNDQVERLKNNSILSNYKRGRNIDFSTILSSEKPIIIYPNIKYFKDSKPPHICANYNHRIDFSEYFEKHLTADIRDQQIVKIKIALDSLLD
ncbi:MAG: restriction endonuclease [Oscillospiraceae bacterium]|nr:restriction endonuclease [Oscillospiraceae bacterium]